MTTTTLNEYFAMLSKHDWDYDQGDLERFKSGSNDRNLIIQISKESQDHMRLYADWFKHKYSNGPHPSLLVQALGTAVGRGKA